MHAECKSRPPRRLASCSAGGGRVSRPAQRPDRRGGIRSAIRAPGHCGAVREGRPGQRVRLTFGSSGNFFTQIQNGAPFDVFLSADIDYPSALKRSSLAERGSLYEYATGRLVLWTRKDSGIDVRTESGRAGRGARPPDRDREPGARTVREEPRSRPSATKGSTNGSGGSSCLARTFRRPPNLPDSGSADVGLLALSLALAPR